MTVDQALEYVCRTCRGRGEGVESEWTIARDEQALLALADHVEKQRKKKESERA